MKKQWIAKYELSQMHGQEHLVLPVGAQVLSVALPGLLCPGGYRPEGTDGVR